MPRVEMNPVLLKSGGQNENGEYMCSVIVLGKHVVTESYTDLAKRTSSLQSMVLECHHALAEASGAEVIVIEGAGSCTELNLIDRDIANLPLVRALKVGVYDGDDLWLCRSLDTRVLLIHWIHRRAVTMALGGQYRPRRSLRPNCWHKNVRLGARLGYVCRGDCEQASW